ncbi:MAG: tRNA pseudouridine(38-40) synthase TruA [Chloroflexota bacterium]|nr:tRNA pseudouridine(38-40) synthase TruA [Chloroflexota bacterium]
MRVKAIVAYDGTEYKGFQIQKDVPTVQEELERVLTQLATVPIRILFAGRTDAGVHATGQVIAFDLIWQHNLGNLHRGMNALLSEQIAIKGLEQVAEDFHPRFDAVRRSYRYKIYRAVVRNPLVGRYSLHISTELSVLAMQKAAQSLIGIHDFGAFGTPPQGNITVREIFDASWQRADDWLIFDITANAFLYRMVRILVGTMLRVGSNSLTGEEFREMLRTQNRRKAGPAVAAQGLTLEAVAY